MTNYVLGFMFSEDKKEILLIEKLQPEWQNGLLNGIGGKVEECESHKKAIIREFREETALLTSWTSWKLFGEMRCSDWAVHLYTGSMDISNFKHTEKEKPVICKVGDVLSGKLKTITNVTMLVQSALSESDFFYIVISY